jgi:hypothetical protein
VNKRRTRVKNFLAEVRAGLKAGRIYKLQELSMGLGMPSFKADTSRELELYLLSQSHAKNAGEEFDPTTVIEALEAAFDQHNESIAVQVLENLCDSPDTTTSSTKAKQLKGSDAYTSEGLYYLHTGATGSKHEVLMDYAKHWLAGNMVHVGVHSGVDRMERGHMVQEVDGTDGLKKSLRLNMFITRYSSPFTLLPPVKPPGVDPPLPFEVNITSGGKFSPPGGGGNLLCNIRPPLLFPVCLAFVLYHHLLLRRYIFTSGGVSLPLLLVPPLQPRPGVGRQRRFLGRRLVSRGGLCVPLLGNVPGHEVSKCRSEPSIVVPGCFSQGVLGYFPG